MAAALLAAGPATGKLSDYRPTGAATFVGARAAEIGGDPRRAAQLYAALAATEPANSIVANRAITQAIAGGDLRLALRLAAARPSQELVLDARLLLAADRFRERRPQDGIALLQGQSANGSVSFLVQPLQAWVAADRRDPRALQLLAGIAADSTAGPLLPELRALILLRLGRGADAEPFARQAVAAAGARAVPLRIAFADGYVRLNDPARALAMLDSAELPVRRARALVARGKPPGQGIDTAAQGFATLLTALAIDLSRDDNRLLPIAMTQIARHAAPELDHPRIVLGLLLGQAERGDDAVAVLRGVKDDSVLAPQARDAEMRALLRSERLQEALARAQAFAQDPDADASDWGRLGDVLDQLDRNTEAATAYARALSLLPAGSADRWQFHLLHGAMLEEADRWPEAKRALEQARILAPQNATVLNYLGYAQLERGENLDAAEALIAEAHRLQPEEASITDSLGWAQFKRGRVDQAIATLTLAASNDAAETEIHEHLGDALYTAGRKFEARQAWNAALVTADDKVRPRLQSKLGAGLNPGNAAP